MPFKEPVHTIVKAILDSYTEVGGINHLGGNTLPSMEAVEILLRDLQNLVFPGYYETLPAIDRKELPYATAEHVFRVAKGLISEVDKALSFGRQPDDCTNSETAVFALLKSIPDIRLAMKEDVSAMLDGDPAATSGEEIILAYPGIEAILVHRLAHVLYLQRVPLIPRMMSELIHRKTGIDIHPGATIGKRFYIDHGTGIVIGETCVIGDDVKLYQGVTLGALSVKKRTASKKRHPTIEDHVTIYAGATILGGETVIGRLSTLGGNVWITESVPAASIILNKPQEHLVAQRDLGASNYSI
ncbi:MAG: serine O-acetyltransferase EpsC [Spirochaetales bacterium]